MYIQQFYFRLISLSQSRKWIHRTFAILNFWIVSSEGASFNAFLSWISREKKKVHFFWSSRHHDSFKIILICWRLLLLLLATLRERNDLLTAICLIWSVKAFLCFTKEIIIIASSTKFWKFFMIKVTSMHLPC